MVHFCTKSHLRETGGSQYPATVLLASVESGRAIFGDVGPLPQAFDRTLILNADTDDYILSIYKMPHVKRKMTYKRVKLCIYAKIQSLMYAKRAVLMRNWYLCSLDVKTFGISE